MYTYEVSIHLEVRDEEALFEAAVAKLVSEGMIESEARIHLRDDDLEPGEQVRVTACLQALIDPGESPPGTKILESRCE